MKIILSRKGFDSSAGKMASPILPDGTLLSLPIPLPEKIRFSDLNHNGKTYLEIIKQLKPKSNIIHTCHVDPDLRKDVLHRKPNWIPAFGQAGKDQTILKREGIKKNDLFLFFGWFKETEYDKDGNLRNLRGKYQNKHIIWGYLQIEKIYDEPMILKNFPSNLKHHPHYLNRHGYKNNCIYVARKTLSFNPKLPGAGVFKLDKNLVLTKTGNYTRTQWSLPDFFHDQKIKIGGQIKNPYKRSYYDANSGPGQEFVIQENPKVTRWAKNIISSGLQAKKEKRK